MSNRIILALMASVEDTGSFITPPEILFARGKLIADGTPEVIANAMIAGVNAGLYYAYLFAIPEKKDLVTEKDSFQADMLEEMTAALKVAKESRRLLDD